MCFGDFGCEYRKKSGKNTGRADDEIEGFDIVLSSQSFVNARLTAAYFVF